MTNDALINGEIRELTETEVESAAKFHKNRIPFIWVDGNLYFNLNKIDDRDHQHWVYEDFCIPAEIFETLPRGYILPGRIQFFEGSDFKPTDLSVIRYDVPEVIRRYRAVYGDSDFEMYNGVTVGEVGTVWEPIIHLDKSRYM